MYQVHGEFAWQEKLTILAFIGSIKNIQTKNFIKKLCG